MNYCPRCDRETEWGNVAAQGCRLACLSCGLQEAERVTEDEWGRFVVHRPELAELTGRRR